MDNTLQSEPMQVVRIKEREFTILGTAHVSQSSATTVKNLIDPKNFDAVAVELCINRYTSITDPDSISRIDLFDAIRSGRIPMITANLALSAFQQRVADQLGIEPGADMRNAIHKAHEHQIPLILIDREIGTTLKRVYHNVRWYQRLKLFSALAAGVITRQKISEDDIERLKKGDLLEASFKEFAEKELNLFKPLIAERDEYMAAVLRKETTALNYRRILVVVGAGHLHGLVRHLESSADPDKSIEELNRIPPPARWTKLIPWVLLGLIAVGLGLGFYCDTSAGWDMIRYWILATGLGCAAGTLLSGGHPVTIVAAFVAAPITTLHPLIGAGMITGAVEAYLRHPHVRDFSQLRHDAASLRGWWRNRVTRIFLVFILSSLGAAVGTYLSVIYIGSRISCD